MAQSMPPPLIAEKQIHSLILDTNPLLLNTPPVSTLLASATELYTIPAVLAEIRDAEARARIELTLLPFLTIRTPRPASMKTITDFARRTGDLEVLSRPDLQVMARAYEIECERNGGDWRLRSVPGQKRVNGPPPPTVMRDGLEISQQGATEVGESGLQKTDEEEITEDTNELVKTRTQEEVEAAIRQREGMADVVVVPAGDAVVETETSIPERPLPIMERAAFKAEAVGSVQHIVQPLAESLQRASLEDSQPPAEQTPSCPELEIEDDDEGRGVDEDDEGEDDEGGWITPSNLKAHQAADNLTTASPVPEQKVMQVAVLTADFAMQNVLLRMNLNLLAPSLQRIKHLKTYVLRCHACFEISKDMSRQFCRKCGGATLLRVACSTDADGKFVVHLKKNMQWNKRGNVFSIPKPVAGSSNGRRSEGGGKGGWGLNLILAEDQKEYVNAITAEKRRKEKDLMDEDFLPALLSGDRRGVQGRPKVGAGRNVNSRRRN